MHQPSSIDRLPETLREQIGKLRVQGRTIDEILAHLKAMDVEVSRSALGRHVKGLATLNERMRHSREMALALVDRFGDQPDNKLQRLNIELMHSVVMQTITATHDDDEGEPQPVTFTPEDAMFLARALKELAAAQKTDADRTLLLRREIAKEQTRKLEDAGRAGDLDPEAIAKAKRILGFDA